MAMLKVVAREEAFRIPQVAGNLFVCAEENGGCCCGHVEKGRAPVNKDLYAREWDERALRNKVHLTFVGCLGPCPVGNNAMLMILGEAVWFKDLNDDRHIGQIFDYVEAVLREGTVGAPGGELAAHTYARYLGAPSVGRAEPPPGADDNPGEFDAEGLDPVCMMTVDPATAQFHSEFAGKRYYFCAASCKRSFDKNPLAYVRGGQAVPTEPMAQTPTRAGDAARAHKTFVVPTISCDHCVRSIRDELTGIPGVVAVQGDPATRQVSVEWAAPASWDQISSALTAIDYPPA